MGILAYISMDDFAKLEPILNRSSRVFDNWTPIILPPVDTIVFQISDGVISGDDAVALKFIISDAVISGSADAPLTFNIGAAVISDGTVDPIVLPVITVTVTFE